MEEYWRDKNKNKNKKRRSGRQQGSKWGELKSEAVEALEEKPVVVVEVTSIFSYRWMRILWEVS